jgi:hypothetical protein
MAKKQKALKKPVTQKMAAKSRQKALLQAKVRALKEEVKELKDLVKKKDKRIDALMGLREYAQHFGNCEWLTKKCTCGLSKIKKKLEEFAIIC